MISTNNLKIQRKIMNLLEQRNKIYCKIIYMLNIPTLKDLNMIKINQHSRDQSTSKENWEKQ